MAAKTEIEALQAAVGSGGGGGGGLQPLNINDQSGTSYTIQETDINNMLVRMAVPMNQMGNIIIPTDANLNAPIGSSLMVSSNGIGVVNITGESGVLVRSPQSKTIDRKYGRIVIIKTGPNEWEIDGQLVNQLQYFVTPYTANHHSSRVSLGFDYLPPGTPMQISMYFYGQSEFQVWTYLQDSMQSSGGVAWNSSTNSTRFGTAEPIDLYFRATLLSGSVDLNPDGGYLEFGEWAKYETPTAGNGWGQNNPKWYTTWFPLPSDPPGTFMWKIRFDVSELPSDSAIIGSFEWTYNVPYQKHLKEHFSNGVSIVGQHFYITSDWKIGYGPWDPIFDLFASNMDTPAPGFGSDWASADHSDLFFRVTCPNGFPSNCTYTGSITLGDIVSGTNIYQGYNQGLVSFTGPDTENIVFQIEVLSDKGASNLRVLTSDTVVLGTYSDQIAGTPPSPFTVPATATGEVDTNFGIDLSNYFTPTSGVPILSYGCDDTLLPNGITLVSINGSILTLHADAAGEGQHTITVSATNMWGTSTNTVDISVSVLVTAPSWVYYSNPWLDPNTIYVYGNSIATQTIDLKAYAQNHVGNGTTWAVVGPPSNALPAGMTLDANTGVITGWPTVTATSEYQFIMTNAGGTSDYGSLWISTYEMTQPEWSVYEADGLSDWLMYGVSTSSPMTFYVNDSVSITLPDFLTSYGGGVLTYTYSGTLADGLSFDPVNGTISGVVTTEMAATDLLVNVYNDVGEAGFARINYQVLL